MEKALLATQLLFYCMGGLGMFFVGIGVLWFVSVYKEKNDALRPDTTDPAGRSSS